MAFGTITSTSNTFGSVDGTATGSVPGTLSGSIGVPGPQGPAGSQGPAGPAGQGVPVGGTAGQFLTKIDGTNYNTDWTTLNVSDKRDLTDYDFTNVADTRLETFGANLIPISGNPETSASFITAEVVTFSVDFSNGGTIDGTQSNSQLGSSGAFIRVRYWESGSPDAGNGINFNTTGISFRNYLGSTSGFTQYGNTSITFPDASVQTIAFPGFTGYAPLASPALTGNPTAPTATFGDNDTSIATTAFVQAGLLGGTANARNLEVEVRNQSGSTIPAGSIVYISGATGNLPLITLAQANNDANSAQTIGFVKTAITNNGTGYVIVRGVLEAINTSALTEGVQLYLSPTTAGTWTTTKPSAPQHLVYVGVVIRSHPTQGTILVAVQNGYELHELHDVALASEANNDLLVYELSTDLWKNKSAATLGLAGLNSPTFTGTPSLPTGTTAVTQSINDNSTKLVTTAGLRDNLSDCTWSVPPITTTTTATSGTGAAYVNASPDFGYLTGPNANLAGFCQKYLLIFARSNSAYGFNFTKEIRVACKMAISWSGTSTGITYNLFFRVNSGSGTGSLSQIGFGISINMATKVLSIQAHDGTTLTTKATSWAFPSGIRSVDFMVKSDGTGTVYAYADGVLIDSTTGMSTATNSGAVTSALNVVEIVSAGGTSTGGATGYVCNLRSFVAHG